MLVHVAGSAAPQVKLLDFGVAKIREDTTVGVAVPSANNDGLLTSAGALMGTSKILTTVLMKTHTAHGNVEKVAVGYVRVSTLEQASEGVSLDAQRDKLTGCSAHASARTGEHHDRHQA